MDSLKLATFNCTGFKEAIINNLIDNYTSPYIIGIQETWRYNLNEISTVNKMRCSIIHNSAMDPNIPLIGRPHGGVGMLIHKTIAYDMLASQRYFIVISAQLSGMKLTIVNLYLPPYNSLITEEQNYLILAEILGALSEYLEGKYDIVLLGDLNFHPEKRTRRTCQIEEFLNSLSMSLMSDKKFLPTNCYTYQSSINQAKSFIDRILCSYSVESYAYGCNIKDEYLGSEHWLLEMSFSLKPTLSKNGVKINRRRPNWNKITERSSKAYRKVAHDLCKAARDDFNVNGDANKLLIDTNNALEYAASMTIPKSKSKYKSKHQVPGWNVKIAPIQQEILHWKNIIDNNLVPQIVNTAKLNYRRAKAKYRIEVRKIMREKREKIAESVAENNTSIFKFTKSKPPVTDPPALINETTRENQLEMWQKYFSNALKGQDSPLSNVAINLSKDKSIAFNVTDVLEIIRNEFPKSFGKSYEHNEHYYHAPIIAVANVTLGINKWLSLLQSGESTELSYDFLKSIITPVPKSGPRNYGDPRSWRPITCCSSICYILEKLLKQSLEPFLSTRDNQFAYKKGHGTMHPLTIINEASSKVKDFHVALLDASSAFDNLSWRRIEKELVLRNVPFNLRVAVMGILQNTSYSIKWLGKISQTTFFSRKGIKQGGCISAQIFAACYDKIIGNCKTSNAGIILHGLLINILVYADDVLLCSTSPYGLKILLDRVNDFCNEYQDISINAKKSVILRMGCKGMKKSPVSVEGIPVANSAQYLGIWLNDPKKEESRVIRSLFCRANQTLKQNNVSLCTVNTKKQLVSAYGSVYGIESLTSISSKMKGAHRYLVKQVFQKEWRSLADLSNNNGWLDIRSRTLYVGLGIKSLPEIHRILRNNFIIKSRQSQNSLVTSICGNASYAI